MGKNHAGSHVRHWDMNALLAVAVYFVQGAVAVTGMAEFLLTRNAFHFSWIQISLLGALTVLTWSIKPVYGFLTDLLPLFGSRRKNYLLIASLLPCFGYLWLALGGTSFLSIAAALIILNIGLGFSDVIVDGLIVERSTPETVGWYQSICWRVKAVGIFFASLFSGMIIERGLFSSWLGGSALVAYLQRSFSGAFPATLMVSGFNILDIRFTFLVTGLLPVITFITVLFMKEPEVSADLVAASRKEIPSSYIYAALGALVATLAVLALLSPTRTPLVPLIGNDALSSLLIIAIWSGWIMLYAKHLVSQKMASPSLIYAAIFLFLWQFTPSFGAPWSNYFLNTLKLSQEKLGLLASLQPLGWVIGSFLYVRFLDRLPIKKVLLGTVLASVVLSLTQLILATPELAMGLGSVSFVKYLSYTLLTPTYYLVYGGGAWHEIMNQSPILNLDSVLSFFLQILFICSFLPLLKLAALVTPKGVEATNFAVLMSVMNLGTAFGAISGGMIYQTIEGSYSVGGIAFNDLHLTIIIGAVTSLFCLIVLPRLQVEHRRG